MGHLQDTAAMIGPAVRETIANLALTEADEAVKRLAVAYADQIDAAGTGNGETTAAETLRQLGPPLLAALTALGATPAARARVMKGAVQPVAAQTQLDRLRQARAARPR